MLCECFPCKPCWGTLHLSVNPGFRVQVKESEGLAVSGAVDLVLGDGKLALHTPDSGR